VDAGFDQSYAPIKLYCFIRNTKRHVMDGAHTHLPALRLRLMQNIDARRAAWKFESMTVPVHAHGREPQDPEKSSRRFRIVLAQRNAVEIEARDDLTGSFLRWALEPGEKRQQCPRRPAMIAEVEVIRSRIVKIDRALDQPEFSHPGAIVEDDLRIPGQCGQMVQPEQHLTYQFARKMALKQDYGEHPMSKLSLPYDKHSSTQK